MRKKLLLIGAGLVLLIVVVAVAAVVFLDANRFRPQVQATLEQGLHRKVSLGDLHLNWFPTRVQANNVQIAEDPRFQSSKPFAELQQLNIAVNLLPLLHGALSIDSMELLRPRIQLIADRDGHWNFATLGGQQTQQPANQANRNLSLDLLKITDAQIAVTDLAKSPKPDVYDHIDLTLRNTHVNQNPDKMAATGSLTLENARVRGVDLGYPVTMDYDVLNDTAASLIHVNKLNLKLGDTPISLAGTINTKPTPVELNLQATASGVSIAEVARLASAMGIAFAPGTTVTGTLSSKLQIQGTSEAPLLNGTVDARELKATGKQVPVPVSIPAMQIALSPSEIQSNNFNVIAGKTAMATKFGLRNYSSKSPLMDVALRAPNAALPEVLSMAKAFGVTGLDKISGQGNLNLDLRASGPVESGASTNALLRAVNGNLNLNFANVRLAGTDLNYQLSSIGGFLKPGQKDQGFTNILKVTGSIPVKNGIAQTNDLNASTEIGNLAAVGTADLVHQGLNMDVTAVISKAVSQQVGSTGVGGYLNTVLANSNGELVLPVIVTGTFDHPKFVPDAKKIAQMKLKGILPSFNNPSAGAAGILGGLLGNKAGNQTGNQPPANQPANQVRDILGGFLGGKKKQPAK
jgi:AsmA protein